MYKRMLIPLDGSELAEVVFTYAKELAGRLGIDLVLLNVCSEEEAGLLPMRRGYVERMADIVRDQSMMVQNGAAGCTEVKPIEAEAHVVTGYPAEEILRYAEQDEIDLILLASHGKSGIKRWALGSVADKVLRAAGVPVLLVRAGLPKEVIYDQFPTRSIVVPLDGSKLAETALPHAQAIAKQRGADSVQIVLLRICELTDMTFPDPGSYYLIPDQYPRTRPVRWEVYVEQELRRRQSANQEYLDTIAKALQADGLQTRTKVLVGDHPLLVDPATEILEYVKTHPTNLVVMSTHGRSGVARWSHGSVAEKIMQGGDTPVLLIRPK
ncbi:MAG TPA: universal stress protein [bacterium]|nr:universal stress protein [bacterium]